MHSSTPPPIREAFWSRGAYVRVLTQFTFGPMWLIGQVTVIDGDLVTVRVRGEKKILDIMVNVATESHRLQSFKATA